MIGLDIGGANTKVATDESYEIVHFPIWKKRDEFGDLLRYIKEKYGSPTVSVVITAELSDIFRRKEDGITFISNELERVFERVYYLNVEGEIKCCIDNPRDFMATNWIASCKFLLEMGYRDFVFVDVGSTTTDMIPVKDRVVGKTDLDRLLSGELLYIGVLRTPTFHLTDLNTSTEFFSITADVFRVLGDIDENDYICETPDGNDKSYESCMNRLSRLFCSDFDELDEEFLISFAKSVKENFISRLVENLMKFRLKGFDLVMGCGIGEFLIRESANRVGMSYTSVEDVFGFSDVFPAYAVLQLCKRFIRKTRT
jgi:probable H4MPT-linked C1 transfer pathway protein